MDEAVADAVERSVAVAGALAQERETFAARVRASHVREMGSVVASAVGRIRAFERAAETVAASQLEQVWRELRRQRVG